MRSLLSAASWTAALTIGTMASPATALAGESDSKTLSVTATIGSRTSLKVSTQLLQFEVSSPDQQAVAVVDFSAGARTHSGAEVILTVEPLRAITGPGGASDVETALTYAGQGDGTLSGVLQPSTPAVAGRWSGSGLRTGRVMFELHASASGRYTLPVRFALSAP